MQFRVFIFPTDFTMSIVDFARAAEDHGFESLWVPEQTHIPVSRRSPWPGGPELPREYTHALDPFVALGAATAVTTRLRLGTGVCLVIERDPITLAKCTVPQVSIPIPAAHGKAESGWCVPLEIIDFGAQAAFGGDTQHTLALGEHDR